jgi:hypothetical protein
MLHVGGGGVRTQTRVEEKPKLMKKTEMAGLGQSDEATSVVNHFYVNFDAEFEFYDDWFVITIYNMEGIHQS